MDQPGFVIDEWINRYCIKATFNVVQAELFEKNQMTLPFRHKQCQASQSGTLMHSLLDSKQKLSSENLVFKGIEYTLHDFEKSSNQCNAESNIEQGQNQKSVSQFWSTAEFLSRGQIVFEGRCK